jgi:hypothetical protein
MSKTVMPPQRPYTRARSRRIFNQLFSPRENGRLHEVDELPTEPDEHHWWTAVDLAPDTNSLYLLPGFRLVNRLGFVETTHAWGGDADQHPLYLY